MIGLKYRILKRHLLSRKVFIGKTVKKWRILEDL